MEMIFIRSKYRTLSPHVIHDAFEILISTTLLHSTCRYQKLLSTVAERELMVSGSDDFTLFLWNPSQDKKFIARMTGHQVRNKERP